MGNFRFIEKCRKRIRCTWCGHFVSYRNLREGKATHIMVLPDSDCSYETWETTCKRCRDKNEK